MKACDLLVLWILVFSALAVVHAQSSDATLTGRVTDPTKALISGAKVDVINAETNVKYSTTTNSDGMYSLPSLPPGNYRMEVEKIGFKTIIRPDIVLHVQDVIAINFDMSVGSISESMTVEGGAPLVNTENATVGTVIDQQFVENLPLNGRSFNTLLQLTPGVVIVPSNSVAPGQFSINGQRTDGNYFSVDGVSVNFSSSSQTYLAQGGNGGGQAFNAFGGTSSLVSVDAMQEFRVETSSFAPEYGHTPGGQVLITTRSGTNDFRGSAFDYFRNDILDANDWFANRAGLPRAAERQNDFGGVFGGPISHDRTFFFLSYEGLRLRQPQTTIITVPSASIRTNAVAAAQPILDAFPMPNGPSLGDGSTAQFTGNYSNKVAMDAGSVRIDHTFRNGLNLFGRLNFAPSSTTNRVNSLNNLFVTDVDTRTLTLGANYQISPVWQNAFRINFSKQSTDQNGLLDTFGGAKALDINLLIPANYPLSSNEAFIEGVDTNGFNVGHVAGSTESQLNVVDDVSVIRGSHQIKFGFDIRSLDLRETGLDLSPSYYFLGTSAFAATGNIDVAFFQSYRKGEVVIRNFGIYAQDRWKAGQRLTVTYGLRWEANPAPSPRNGTILSSWLNVNDPATIALAPNGTSIYSTTLHNFGPRLGVAYRLNKAGDFVIRGGWGVFYDLGTGVAPILLASFPNSASQIAFNVQLPIPNYSSYSPSFSTEPPYPAAVTVFDPHLKLPYAFEWNVALEKALGSRQSISVTYVGQSGRRQLRQDGVSTTGPNFTYGYDLTLNAGSSDYNALQLQFKRSLTRGLQALVNYTWSHSIDTGSDDITTGVTPSISLVSADRGSSDFDVRHNVTGTLTYEIPSFKKGLGKKLSEDWSLSGVLQARSGFPIQIFTYSITGIGFIATPRPDRNPGQPVWIPDPTTGPGKKLNPDAFQIPSTTRQGDLPRNSIYGLGATQIDLSVRRGFALSERVRLGVRADAFNLFNHPNYTNPDGQVENADFGVFTQLLNRGLGGLSPIYQMGGPRSLQLSLRLAF